MTNSLAHVLRLAMTRPGPSLRVALALARGMYYRWKFALLGRRVIIGRRFRVHGKLDIRGPGTVVFGDDCIVISSRMAITTPYTQSPEAVIRFGNRVFINGARLSCQTRIEVGDGATLADTRIMDTDFHALTTHGRLRYNTEGATKPVIIGANAWLGAGSMVLKGVTIGENAVVGAMSLVSRDIPPNTLAAGNPARVIRELSE